MEALLLLFRERARRLRNDHHKTEVFADQVPRGGAIHVGRGETAVNVGPVPVGANAGRSGCLYPGPTNVSVVQDSLISSGFSLSSCPANPARGAGFGGSVALDGTLPKARSASALARVGSRSPARTSAMLFGTYRFL